MTSVVATPAPVAINLGNSANAIVLIDANPALANLNIGSLIQGVVIGRDARGQTIVEADFGRLTLSTRIDLPVGSTVVLQVQTAGARITAIVLSINDQSIGNPLRLPLLPSLQTIAPNPRPASTGTAAPAPAGEGSSPAAEIVLSTGTVVTAVILRPAAPVATAAGASTGLAAAPDSAQLPEGSQLTVRIVEVRPPTNLGSPPDLGSPTPEAGSETQHANAAGSSASGPAPRSSPQFGSDAPEVSGSGGTPKQIVATVLGPGAKGQIEVRTPIGTIELPLPSNPPTGSTIILEQEGEPKLALPSPLGAATPAEAAANLSNDWPALRQAVAVLESSQARGIPDEMVALPRPGPQLALGLIAFVAALENRSTTAGLGAAAIRQLGTLGQADLAAQLRIDFEHLSALANENGEADWRSFFIPVVADRMLSQVRLFLRRREPRRDGQVGRLPVVSGGQRFIVELELSRLGAVQIDGFLKERQLNLILRSHHLLAQSLRKALEVIFSDALAAADLTGALGFQTVASRFPTAPLEAAHAKSTAIVI